jgi:hypothetical protein
MFKMLFAVLFSAGYSHHSNRKTDKKIAQMRKEGWGIRVLQPDGTIKFIPIG